MRTAIKECFSFHVMNLISFSTLLLSAQEMIVLSSNRDPVMVSLLRKKITHKVAACSHTKNPLQLKTYAIKAISQRVMSPTHCVLQAK